ncbi:hypothetical protein I5I84_00525 [Pseudomonas aeruginosa]|nr:hypothetical protein [Pseudomonas aeruginosa]
MAETQSIRDDGIDVFWKFKDSQGEKRIGFQIKSNLEAIANSKKNERKESMIATLKRQGYEALGSAKIDEWWIVTCFDFEKFSALVQQINADVVVKPYSGFSGKIKLINPLQAMAFLSKDKGRIDTICTKLLCQDDEFLRTAQAEADGLSAAAFEIVTLTIGRALEGERRQDEESFWGKATDFDFDTDLGNLSMELEERGYLDSVNHSLELNPAAFPGLCALYYEGKVRHDMNCDESTDFIREMLRCEQENDD